MNQELIFILKILQSTVISRCDLIDYKCSETVCNNCPISIKEEDWKIPIEAYGYRLIQLGNL